METINNRVSINDDVYKYKEELRQFLYQLCAHANDDTPCSLCTFYRKNPEIGMSYYCMHKDHPENSPDRA